MATLQGHADTHAGIIAQEAIYAALTGPMDFLDSTARFFQGTRDIAVQSLNGAGFRCFNPEGAIYIWMDASAWQNAKGPGDLVIRNDQDLANFILETKHVALVPGSPFMAPVSDMHPGDPGIWLRMCFANATRERALEACVRIEQACSQLVRAPRF